MENNNQQIYLYKILLLGDQGVGKTHLLNRYVKGQVPKYLAPTIGIEFATTAVNLKDGGKIKAQVWDTAGNKTHTIQLLTGQEKYKSITSAHYRNSVGAFLVYDITKLKSFESIQKWMEDIRTHCDPDIILMLLGNKLDLVDINPQQRKVKQQVAEQFAKENNILFEETSATQSHYVQDAFEKLIEAIYDQKSKMVLQNTIMNDTVYNPNNDTQLLNSTFINKQNNKENEQQKCFCDTG